MKEDYIAQIRSFNRFYTMVIGILDKNYLNTEFSLTESRIMYELNTHPEGMTARDFIELLQLDKGYLSRILQQFEKKKLIEKKNVAHDKRSYLLYLSQTGKQAFSQLNENSQLQTEELLSPLKEKQMIKLIEHMNGIRQILSQTNI